MFSFYMRLEKRKTGFYIVFQAKEKCFCAIIHLFFQKITGNIIFFRKFAKSKRFMNQNK